MIIFLSVLAVLFCNSVALAGDETYESHKYAVRCPPEIKRCAVAEDGYRIDEDGNLRMLLPLKEPDNDFVRNEKTERMSNEGNR